MQQQNETYKLEKKQRKEEVRACLEAEPAWGFVWVLGCVGFPPPERDYPGRQAPQTLSPSAVPGVTRGRLSLVHEVCGRQRSASNASEKLPAGHV